MDICLQELRMNNLLSASGSLTYSRLRELLRAKLAQLGYNSNEFGVHSLQVGGATRAAIAGVLDRLFRSLRQRKMGILRVL